MSGHSSTPSPALGGGAGVDISNSKPGRICTVCKLYKDGSCFSIKDGRLRAQCKSCRSQQQAAREFQRKAVLYSKESSIPGETAQCTQCGEVKSIAAFHKSTGKTRRMPFCKVCRQKMYLGVEQVNESAQIKCTYCGLFKEQDAFYKRGRHCKSCKAENASKYRARIKSDRPDLIENKRVASLKYYIDNRAECIARTVSWSKKRRIIDPAFRVKQSLMSRLRAAILGAHKIGKQLPFSATDKTQELVGCSAVELIAHLEAGFKPGMTWLTYGLRGWHIDHIRPCASFDLTDPEQQRQCFHYSNLQPLWWNENLSKGAKMPSCLTRLVK